MANAPESNGNASLVLSAVEGLAAMVLLTMASQYASFYASDADTAGMTRLAAVLVAFLALYSMRFRPVAALQAIFDRSPQQQHTLQNRRRTTSFAHAILDVCQCLLRSLRLVFSWAVVLVIALHVVQLAVVAHSTPSLSSAVRCLTFRDALVGVIHEEFQYRVVLFTILLHRSGGDILFSVAGVAMTFAALHLGNLWSGLSSDGSLPTPSDPYVLVLPLLRVLVAAVAGATYALEYANSGSLGNCILMHALNNIVALLWIALVSPDGTCTAAMHPPAGNAHFLFASLLVQLLAYGLAGVWSIASLRRVLEHAASVSAFRRRHSIVYGGGDVDVKNA